MLDLARALAARGLCVIPVPRPRPGGALGTPGDGKVPALAWKAFQTRQPTDDEMVQWFSGPPMNLAIITGAISDVVVIDADSPEALRWCTARLPYTPWQTKTARGFHLIYQHPGGVVANRARLETGAGRLAIDCRGDGGYVIAPGSIHASGATYEFGGDWTVARTELPRFWPGWLQRPERIPATRPIVPVSTGDIIMRARKYLAAIPVPIIGQGSDAAVLSAACRLTRGFALSSCDAESLLWEWCGNRSGWTRGWVAQKVSHAERYGTEPMGALR
jgi:hypothetical protein